MAGLMKGLRFVIDIFAINTKDLLITEYLTLYHINLKNCSENFPLFFKVFIPTESDYKGLMDKGFILKSFFNHSGYTFTAKAEELFPDVNKKFEEFYTLFPHKVPDQSGHYRPVSTKDPNSASAATTRKIWNNIVGSNPALSDMIIKGLKAELIYRERARSLTYLNNIDTWLRNYTWEKWINNESEEEKEDKNNTIKL